jgi:hypothetical protein
MGILNNIIAEGDTIQRFIPQRSPMIMVEKLHMAEGGKTISSLSIKQENIFCKAGLLEEPGLIENIAQTAALGVGFAYSNQSKNIPTGYIGAIQKLNIYKLPNVNSIIYTEVNVEHEVFNTTLINGKITCDDQVIVDCTMKIFLDEKK